MPEVQVIAAYLRSMTFRKKTFGGCDAESVLEHFVSVSQQYEAILSAFMAQNQQYAFQIVALQNIIAQKQLEGLPESDLNAIEGNPGWPQLAQWNEGNAETPQIEQGREEPYCEDYQHSEEFYAAQPYGLQPQFC